MKNVYVDIFAAFVDGKLLDAGCGEGIHLKRLLKQGYDIFGIELSEICCEKYLRGFPHQNIDIVSFAKQHRQFKGIICMDVLEHIIPQAIDETMNSLKLMSNNAFLGIANHSDIINDIELHLIQEDSNWWVRLLKKYYKEVIVLTELYDGRFFFIQCTNDEQKESYPKVYDVVKALQQKKQKIEQEKAKIEQEKAKIEQEKAKVEQEKAILNNRYRYFEKLRKIASKIKEV